MARERVSCALPRGVYERVREIADRRECSIGQAVGFLLDGVATPHREEERLEARVSRLEEVVRRLAARLASMGGEGV